MRFIFFIMNHFSTASKLHLTNTYVSDEALLSRVPGLMLILGTMYFIIQEFNSYNLILPKAIEPESFAYEY